MCDNFSSPRDAILNLLTILNSMHKKEENTEFLNVVHATAVLGCLVWL